MHKHLFTSIILTFLLFYIGELLLLMHSSVHRNEAIESLRFELPCIQLFSVNCMMKSVNGVLLLAHPFLSKTRHCEKLLRYFNSFLYDVTSQISTSVLPIPALATRTPNAPIVTVLTAVHVKEDSLEMASYPAVVCKIVRYFPQQTKNNWSR